MRFSRDSHFDSLRHYDSLVCHMSFPVLLNADIIIKMETAYSYAYILACRSISTNHISLQPIGAQLREGVGSHRRHTYQGKSLRTRQGHSSDRPEPRRFTKEREEEGPAPTLHARSVLIRGSLPFLS